MYLVDLVISGFTMDRHGLSDRAKGYILGNDLLMGFAFAVVSTRFYCRIRMGSKRGLWWDDLFILFAFVCGPCSMRETSLQWTDCIESRFLQWDLAR